MQNTAYRVQWHWWYTAIAAAAGIITRVALPWHSVFDNGIVKFNTVDAYYFLQQAKLGNITDLWTWILSIFNNEIIAAILPMLIYLCCIPIVYCIVQLIFKNSLMSGISTSLFCIMPGELQNRTALGAADHHALEIIILLLAMLSLAIIIRSKNWYRLFGIVALLSLTLAYYYTWGGWLVVVAIIGIWLSIIIVEKIGNLPYEINGFATGGFILVILLTIVITELFIFQGFHDSILHNLSWQINTTVNEEMPLLYTNGMLDLTVWMQNYAMLFYPGLLGLGILMYDWYQDMDKGKLLLIVWSVVLLVLTLAQRRWTYYSEINIALLTGYCAWWFLSRFDLRKITIIIMACIIFILPVEQGIMMGLSTNGYIPDEMHNSLVWLKQQPNGIVLSQWDNGYWIEYYAGKQAYATPGGSNKDQNRKEITALFETGIEPDNDYRYILLDRRTVEGLSLSPDAYISRLWNNQAVIPVYSNQDIKIFDMEEN
ncbi:MAG: hypothetical protein PHW28_06770 [Mesotoga sp.]|nr:hypothetical protein [Mesotoga sp.]